MAVKTFDLATFEEQVRSAYVDVIGEKLGGKVVGVSDEFFAEASNLIKPKPAVRELGRFTYNGAWYDGWETRRHNPEPADWVVFKFGVASAQIIGCEVDTAHFNGNQAPAASVECAYVEAGEPDASTVWDEVLEKTECGPSCRQFFVRAASLTDKSYNFARLKMFPDGGIARFRLYGRPKVVLPTDRSTVLDLASVFNGGLAIAQSDQHFGTTDNLLLPGRGVDMGDGWETTRSRLPGHEDWVEVQLGARAVVQKIVVDTAFFRGNFPDRVRVEGIDKTGAGSWRVLVPEQKAKADFEHEYTAADVLQNTAEPVTHVRLVMIPDGGCKRLRVFGTVA
ncbi:galactose-binding domain-like protein [Dipodascopsis tothii]|uniref:galactose-binding domain-like protein n=1 Tax=Dipodascopsis tothii TaxID=44089 RepID=UPI0034CEB62A